MKEGLSDRKLRILQFIIEEYIQTAEPIGSRTISKNKSLGISAATVRNEMSDLEDMGYLYQPHISAGRIPSALAYNLYVDKLMEQTKLEDEEKRKIESVLTRDIDQMQNLLNDTLDILSQLTNYTSLAVTKRQKNQDSFKITHFDLVYLNENTILIILVTKNGLVQNRQVTLDRPIDADKLRIITTSLRENIIGKEVKDLDQGFVNYVKNEIMQHDKMLDELMRVFCNAANSDEKVNLILKGTTNILNFPEFNNIDMARSLLTFLDDKENVIDALGSKGITKGDINIIIGDPSEGSVLSNCSLITADFSYKGQSLGKLGILGPSRMDYEKVYGTLQYITGKLNDLLGENS